MSALLVLLCAPSARADGISGYLEYLYGTSSMKTRDISGVSSSTRNDSFLQRYNLAMDKTLYPLLTLSAGGLYEDTNAHATTDGISSDSSTTRLSPYVDLALKNNFVSSGLGYRRREETTSSNGQSTPKLIQNEYTANLGWRPAGLPTFSLFYTKRDFYDELRTSQDLQTESYTWSSTFREIKGLEVNYGGSYSQNRNNLLQSETQSFANSGRIAYSDSYLGNRVLFHTGYSFALQNSTIISHGTAGLLYTAQTAQSQLFATTPDTTVVPPTTVTSGALTAVSSFPTVNLVLPQNTVPPAVLKQNNIGLVFPSPLTVSTLFLSVTSKGAAPSSVSLSQVAGNFSWQVYTSTDGVNWSGPTVPTVTTSTNPADFGISESGFLLSFPAVTTQYVKVVETPAQIPITVVVPADIDAGSILLSRLLSFSLVQGKAGTSSSSSNIGGVLDVNARVQLLEALNLSWDFSFVMSHSKSDESSLATTYLMSNGVSFSRRLNEILTSNGRVAEDFSMDSQSKVRNSLSYSAGLNATPLPTLNHSLVYGGRTDISDSGTSTTNSVYLNNSAALYRGLSLNVGAGYSTSSDAKSGDTDSVSFTAGLDMVPNKDLTLGLSYQDSTAEHNGGGQPRTTSFIRNAAVSATYRPFVALYLVGGYSIYMQNDRSNVSLVNYGAGWSPFAGGDLQINMNYTESLTSTGNEKVTTYGPSVRWNIRSGSSLDLSYNRQKTVSDFSGSTDVNSFSAQLRIAL
ncbi:hypothetical protein GMLC_40020 [Geomonas limicola]|uniref:Uncharacterized protein n=1 Tax=Geomonas limicola TaxID=2740186 RepID=A0A6V8NFR3_9BACT|nr:hypothetical protein GMLC_40020 [Geomonas limicola]